MAIRRLEMGGEMGGMERPFDQYAEFDDEDDALLPGSLLGKPNPNPPTTNPTLAAPAPPGGPGQLALRDGDRPAGPVPNDLSELPDGMGGTVNVPPPGLAPPEPLGLSPMPAAPMDAGGGSIPLDAPFVQPFDPNDVTPMDAGPGSIPGWEQPFLPPVEGSRIDDGIQTVAPPDSPPGTVPPPAAPPEVDTRELPEFSPEDNLLDTVIRPTANARSTSLEGQADELMQGDIARMTAGGDEVLPEADPRVLKLQGYSDAAIEKIMGGPDRYAIAEDKWRDWLAKTAPDYEQVIRGATEEGAAHGRMGSGMMTNRYGDLATSRTRDMDLTGKEFMREALEGSIGDRERALGMIRNVLGQEQGEGRAVRGEKRIERETGYARRAGARDELRTAADRGEARDSTERDELRGERDFQRSSASEAIARRIMQREMENSEQQQGFENAITLMDRGGDGNPSDAEMAASAQAAAEAAGYTGDISELIRFYMLQRAQNGAAAPAGR